VCSAAAAAAGAGCDDDVDSIIRRTDGQAAGAMTMMTSAMMVGS